MSYREESAAQIAARQADVARLGARKALDRWIAQGTQGARVLDVLTDADFAHWDDLWPAPNTTEAS